MRLLQCPGDVDHVKMVHTYETQLSAQADHVLDLQRHFQGFVVLFVSRGRLQSRPCLK